MSTPTRKFGDMNVFPVGYGAMTLSIGYTGERKSDEERFKLLDEIFESGCNFWDSADVYGDSEDLLGKWFKRTGKRSSIVLATKFGFMPDRSINGSAARTKEAVESSLKRLGVEYIDIFYLHRPDTNTPIEVTIGAIAEFVKAGKIRHVGISECSASTLRRAHAVHPIAAIQVEYSPFALDIEAPEVGLLATARELGVKIVAYSPLGRGLLTGQIKSPDDFDANDFRRMIPRFSKENFPNIISVVSDLERIGARHGATGGQIALAWLLAQGEDVIPIPGTTRIKYFKENMGAAAIKLSPDEVSEVRRIAEHAMNAIPGGRYPPGMQEQLFTDTPPVKT